MNKIQDYLNRSKDDYIIPINYTENENGFITYRIIKDKVVVINCYGNGKYWQEFIENLARKHNISKIIITTKRNYKPFIKKYGGKLVGYILEKEI